MAWGLRNCSVLSGFLTVQFPDQHQLFPVLVPTSQLFWALHFFKEPIFSVPISPFSLWDLGLCRGLRTVHSETAL